MSVAVRCRIHIAVQACSLMCCLYCNACLQGTDKGAGNEGKGKSKSRPALRGRGRGRGRGRKRKAADTDDEVSIHFGSW